MSRKISCLKCKIEDLDENYFVDRVGRYVCFVKFRDRYRIIGAYDPKTHTLLLKDHIVRFGNKGNMKKLENFTQLAQELPFHGTKGVARGLRVVGRKVDSNGRYHPRHVLDELIITLPIEEVIYSTT